MGFIVLVSNYLVQFPIQYLGLSEILTYGAFSYPITFLITDLANRAYGKTVAIKVVYTGFIIGILLTLFVSTNFSDIISIRNCLALRAPGNSRYLIECMGTVCDVHSSNKAKN